jgi:hypothetical protein
MGTTPQTQEPGVKEVERALEVLAYKLPMTVEKLKKEFKDLTGCELVIYDWDIPSGRLEVGDIVVARYRRSRVWARCESYYFIVWDIAVVHSKESDIVVSYSLRTVSTSP